MKKSLLSFLIIICCSTAFSQTGPSFTRLFDSLFANVNMADATTGLLYDRVVPFANLPGFNSLRNPVVDTINANLFMQGYFELYNAAISPTGRPPYTVNELRNMVPKDTNLINIGIVHYRYNTIDSNVAVQKLYFDEDSVLREDKSIAASLFVEDTIFFASPLVDRVEKGLLYYKVAGSTVFNNTEDEIENVYIDFGDGLGFRNIHFDETIPVYYSDTGTHILHFRLSLSGNRLYDAYSKIVCFQKTTNEIPYPKEIIPIRAKIPIMDYEGGSSLCATGKMCICYAHSDKLLRKPIVVSDGFDPQNARCFESGEEGKESLWKMLAYNNKHLGDTLISVYDYDIVFVDYDDGGEYIERNAMVFVAVIDTLNKMLKQNQSQEQIVVVGPSMGGPVTHYALSYIERNSSAATNFGDHNCRLWIAFDSPQQGANINLGAQAFMYLFGSVGNNEQALYVWDSVINCPAAKQMLKHQFNIYAPVQPFQTCSLTINQYVHHPYFTHFYQSVKELGYPSNCRNLSIINGSLNSIVLGPGCSEAIELDAMLNIRISKIQLFPTSGVCELFYGMYASTIDYIFGRRNKFWLFAPSDNNFSIDAAPGGTFNTFQMIQDAAQTNKQIKQITMSRSSHCFMPITSTLDISGNMNYGTNISSRDLVAEGLTPFDSYIGVMDSNMYHATLNQNIVDYLINEIETYIQGPREVQLCTRPTYTLHLPQDSVATVTWSCSDSIRLITGSNPYEVTVVPLATGDGWISAEVSTLKHRKRLANYPIHITQNSLPEIDTVSYVTDTLQVNTTMLLGSTLSVDSNKTLLVSGTLHCAPLSRIIVRPGGKLIVDGGTLTSACEDGMWQGIYVEGHRDQPQTAANQGTVQFLNGAVVENAFRGIRTSAPGSGWNTTGGIITADSATFRNCAKAVEYLSYAGTNYAGQVMDNKGAFTNCTFTVDDNNLFAANGTDLLAHVSLWDVKGVEFTHCRFEDARTGNHSRKSAISALDAGFEMKTGCSYNVPRPECDCPPASSTHSSFAGFGTAIDAGTSGSPYGIVIDGAQFSDNITGVRIEGSSHATVTRCQFDLSDMPVRVVTGLNLDTCTGYLVEGNTFTRGASAPNGSRYGIRVGNSGTDANRLYRNTFERLSHGIYVTGTNRDGNSNTGLQMTCNGFTSNTYDIYVASGATVGPSQGDNSKGADNTFSGTQTSSLYNAGNSGIDYYYSTGTNHSPQNPVGNVTLHANAGSNDCASTLCVLDPSIPGPGPKSPTPSFLALKQQYENLMADFNRNGYADILSTAIPPQSGGTPNVNQETIEAAQYASQQINSIAAELYAQSHERVRTLMNDTLEDILAVRDWLDATPGLASRYLEAEAEFATGGSNLSLADIANYITNSEERDEYDNYLAFNSLKEALRYGNGHVAWINATDAQIGELIRIADANTGRSSLLAKNVLCFFFGICYDDDMELRELTTTIPPTAEPPALTGQQNITVHPNPTNDVLHVTVTDGNAKIARVEMFDMFGRITMVGTQNLASPPSPEYTVDLSSLPAGLYILRVTLTDGTVRNVKVVKE